MDGVDNCTGKHNVFTDQSIEYDVQLANSAALSDLATKCCHVNNVEQNELKCLIQPNVL